MHGLHADRRTQLVFLSFLVCLIIPPPAVADDGDTAKADEDGTDTPLAVVIDADQVTKLQCHVTIEGTLTTPTTDGVRRWDLKSTADLEFRQRQLPSEFSGPIGLQAVRHYSRASAQTTVGKDYQTTTTLPRSSANIHVRGADDRLQVAAAGLPLTRQQFDLLQMPCDPLFCSALLPTRDVAVGEKWNTDAWVLPRLTGLEAVTDHSLSCTLQSKQDTTAEVAFTGSASGAVMGSASSVELTGTLTLDTEKKQLTRLTCRMKEQRSAGPVSPGIDAAVEITWTRADADGDGVAEELNEALFERPLTLRTPWRLMIQHSPEWHIFNRNERVVMMRQMRNGALISQCNISSGNAMPPGQHTPDPDFRTDVESEVQKLGGSVVAESTLRDDEQWRIRRVQTSATVNKSEIIRNYYLCTAASGEQYSLMFSHSAADSAAFGRESEQILDTLSLARRPPSLPFRKQARGTRKVP